MHDEAPPSWTIRRNALGMLRMTTIALGPHPLMNPPAWPVCAAAEIR